MANDATLVEAARRHANDRGDKPFLVMWSANGRAETTFAQLWARAGAMCRALQDRGVAPGDVVILSQEAGPDLFAGFLGAMMAGAAPAIMPHPNPKQRDDVYRDSHRELYAQIEPAAFLLTPKVAGLYASLLPETAPRTLTTDEIGGESGLDRPTHVQPDQVAFLQHSSGTTALKKGVMLSHRAVVRHVELYSDAIGLDVDSEMVSWLPLYHDMGLIACFMTPLVLGATVTMIDNFEWVTRPRLFLEAVAARRAEYAWMPNFGLMHLVNSVRDPEAFDLSSLKALINCSEPCRPNTHERFIAHFAPAGFRSEAMQVCYAMAENVFAVSQTPTGQTARNLVIDRNAYEKHRVAMAEPGGEMIEVASCGPLLPGMSAKIVDENWLALPEGQIGEIAIRSDTLFSGYNRRADLTARVLADGWYRTNDMGFFHDGELYVTGRRDDMILAYGRNFMAHELEAMVNGVSGVRPGRAVVFGIESERLGTTEIVVMLELAEGAKSDDVLKAVRARLEATSGIAPRHIEAVSSGELLKTTSGKISRSANREAFLCRSTAATEI